MSQTQSKTAIETIADAEIWHAIVDGVNAISPAEEAAFEFDADGLRVALRDSANVALIAMECDKGGFEAYGVADDVTIGIDTTKFADLLSAADATGDDTVAFDLDAETRKFQFEAGGVEYELAGLDADTIDGSPTNIPAVKDDLQYSVDVDLPVAKWSTATDVVDLAGGANGTFVYDADADTLALEGKGDTDTSRVVLSDHDDFAWRDDTPDTRVEVVQSNQYMTEVVSVLEDADADVVRFVTGTELPYHVWTTHADGRIDTKLMQAPRLTSQ